MSSIVKWKGRSNNYKQLQGVFIAIISRYTDRRQKLQKCSFLPPIRDINTIMPDNKLLGVKDTRVKHMDLQPTITVGAGIDSLQLGDTAWTSYLMHCGVV